MAGTEPGHDADRIPFSCQARRFAAAHPRCPCVEMRVRSAITHGHTRRPPMMARMLCAAAAVSLAGAAPAAAQSPEQFYQGKMLTIMLGHPPGGSYDFYARLAANHIKRHIPGNPNIIVEHRPGGGGIRAVTQFYAQSPRDGTV